MREKLQYFLPVFTREPGIYVSHENLAKLIAGNNFIFIIESSKFILKLWELASNTLWPFKKKFLITLQIRLFSTSKTRRIDSGSVVFGILFVLPL